MSSVVIGWTGRCPDPRVRARLVGHLNRLAEINDDYLRTRLPEPEAVNGARERQAERRSRANIEHISKAIPGPILITSGIVRDPSAFIEAAREAALPALDHPEIDRAVMTLLPGGRLNGIDFRLFGPRQGDSGADRLSFVFLETEATPFLDGRLVQVDRGAKSRDHAAEIMRSASIHLGGPIVHLHGYLEDWIDLLFSWVKYFFIGDLWWRRGEEMQGYEDYREVFSDLQASLGADRAEQATFDAILATFTQHAEHWSGKHAMAAAEAREQV
jgi:hypothetical protein